MPEQDVIKIARDNVDAFNVGDWQRFRAALAADAVYQEPATQRRLQGPGRVVEASQAWRQAFPDVKGTITNALASGNTAVLEITWEGTQTGPLVGAGSTIPPSGKRVTVQAVQVVTVQGNQIKETRHYFDMLGMLQQIGAAAR